MNSILDSIKKLLGISEYYDHFDTDIIIHINTVLGILNQLGVGPVNGYSIEDRANTWDEFLEDNKLLEMVKTYVYLKVRMVFDPPLSSSVAEAINRTISELEWRINVTVDPGKGIENV